MPVLMRCGCCTEAVRVSDGKPVCPVHIGIKAGADEIETNKPNLAGRFAHCSYGQHARRESSFALPFFEYKPNAEEDLYYCGCYGWD